MNKFICKTLLLLTAIGCLSCSKDDDAPYIESVWKNMIAEPIAQTEYAYPGQTICLHGSGFYDLRKIFVNGTDIDITSSFIYDTENYITFQLPKDVNTSTSDQQDYIRVITAHGESVYRPFLVKPANEQPTITAFSSVRLLPGRTLTITGTNLDGATSVRLPLTFDREVSCLLDSDKEQTSTTVYAIIPDGCDFATGRCVVEMQKTNPISGNTYTECVYSSTTDFVN
ncbi:MAG: IPT/TIG domain-containing protein [Prevotella sp.]|nr:IPT/TIG domain-containing protein [Prevotella sp.]